MAGAARCRAPRAAGTRLQPAGTRCRLCRTRLVLPCKRFGSLLAYCAPKPRILLACRSDLLQMGPLYEYDIGLATDRSGSDASEQQVMCGLMLPKYQPTCSAAAGRAWQTPFGTYAPVIGGRPVSAVGAAAVLLQLPVEGPLAAGGVAAIVKRAPGAGPDWLGDARGHDFFFSTAACLSCSSAEVSA